LRLLEGGLIGLEIYDYKLRLLIRLCDYGYKDGWLGCILSWLLKIRSSL